MVYTTNIPQSTDLISNSQAQILGNFQFLGSTTGNVTPGFYKFPNGLILQWGSIIFNTSGNKSQNYAVAFTTQVFNLQFSLGWTSAGNAAAYYTGIVAGVITNPPGAVVVDNSAGLSLTQAKFRVSQNVATENPVILWSAIGV